MLFDGNSGLGAILAGSIFWLPCTLAIYAGSVLLFRVSGKSPLLNPTLLTIGGIALVLLASGVPYERYFQDVAILHYLLGTAVVALAIPLYRNLERLKGCGLGMASALLAGSFASILVGLAVAIVAGLSTSTILSLAPKSATAAVSIEISSLIGGVPAVTATLTILTGIIGAIAGPMSSICVASAPRRREASRSGLRATASPPRAPSPRARSPAALPASAWRSTPSSPP